tara:strand:- start:37 stop:198 length:162 start_codon:yes stop_codon:yes gene_type:complete
MESQNKNQALEEKKPNIFTKIFKSIKNLFVKTKTNPAKTKKDSSHTDDIYPMW